MNERIRELAEQCYEDSSTQIDVEKFAELIVRECAKVITNGGYWTDILSSRKNASPAEISQMIKDYFGVEE